MKSNKLIRTILIDDYQPIRMELAYLLKEYPEVEIVGEAKDGKEAVQLINKLKPDVIFLDIDLPMLSGFQVLDIVPNDFKLVFISSQEKFLIKASYYNSIDFLMKPINKVKLRNVIKKLLQTDQM